MKKVFLTLLVSIFTFLCLCTSFAIAEDDFYDMGIPYLNDKQYTENEMNMVVYWIQVQLKATGRWYQGEIWDCTGNLGDHTMQEISSFMNYRGYPGHPGCVDQKVVNELADYLGSNLQAVYVGGFYDAMGAIMTGGSAGSMLKIVSNLRDMIPRETVGARWVQICLQHLGYYNSSIDGKYGEETEHAVKDFQRAYGFEERDYVSLGVARAMMEAYYYSGGSLYSLPSWSRESALSPRPTHIPHPSQIPLSDPAWDLTFYGTNKDADDNYSAESVLRVGDTIYFHAQLTCPFRNEKVLLHYQITMNGEVVEEDSFSQSFGNGSFVWVRNTPYRHGTLMVSIYYIGRDGTYYVIGSKSVQVEARTSQTQTETARGWISSCDIYFNRYGMLCFDMTSYESLDSSIIYFVRNDNNTNQGTVSDGLIVWDSPAPGKVYEYAIWCGPLDYARDVASLGAYQIPASAWIKLYVTQNKEIIIVSSTVAINIRDNE